MPEYSISFESLLTDGGNMRILEILFTKPQQQARFAYTAVAYDDQL